MHSAPPVLVPVGRFVWDQRMVLALAAATGLALVLAWALSAASGAQATVWFGLWLLATVLAWHRSAADMLPEGQLSWDGEHWHYQLPHETLPREVGIALLWDAGPAMLLRVRSHEATTLVTAATGSLPGRIDGHAWLAAARLPVQWHGLRCAVHAGDTL